MRLTKRIVLTDTGQNMMLLFIYGIMDAGLKGLNKRNNERRCHALMAIIGIHLDRSLDSYRLK